MINFRYHIVSLVAVFMALAIGIVMGVTILGDEINEGILVQAEADRKTVQEQRDQIQKLKLLDTYRDEFAAKAATGLVKDALTGQNVAVVAMPDAPSRVVSDLESAVIDAGGNLTRTVQISDSALDPEKIDDVNKVLEPFVEPLAIAPDEPVGTKFGLVLGRGIAGAEPQAPDAISTNAIDELKRSRLVVDNGEEDAVRAQLIIVVTAPVDADQPPAQELIDSRIQIALALLQGSRGVVLAGPNSTGIEHSDVATARSEAPARDALSTIDVADLPSGVTTVILATREQGLGGQGHYGAATASRDAIAPEIGG